MVAGVNFRALPIVYRMNDIKDIGVTAYVRSFADWFFSLSAQHIVADRKSDYQGFSANVVSVSRGKWLVARAVCLIAFPILFAAKLFCSRASFHVKIVTGNNGDRTKEVRIAPDRSVTYYEGKKGDYTIKNDKGELVSRSEGHGYYSEGRYDNRGQFIDVKMYYPDGRTFKEGKFEYKDNGEVWFTGIRKEAVLVQKKVEGVLSVGTFDAQKNLVRGEKIERGIVYKGEFNTEHGITYLSLGVKIDRDNVVTAGRFSLKGATYEHTFEMGEIRRRGSREFRFSLKPGCCVIDGYRYQMGTCDCIRDVNALRDARFGEIPEIRVNEKRLLFFKSPVDGKEYILFKNVQDTFGWHFDTITAFAVEVFKNDDKVPDFTSDEGKMKLDLVRELCKLVNGAAAPPLNIAIWKHILTHYIAKRSDPVRDGGKPHLSDKQLDRLTRDHKAFFAEVVDAIRGEEKTAV